MAAFPSPVMWIDMPTLTKREGKVMHAWHERLHEISETDGGRELHLLGDGIPTLTKVIEELYPKLKGKRYLEMIGKLVREQQRAHQLVHGQEGSA